MAHENHIAGFLVSTIVHLVIVTFALASITSVHPLTEKEQVIPLKLSMFQPQPEPMPQPDPIPALAQPVIEQVRQEQPPPLPVPKPEHRPRPKPKPKVAHKRRIAPKPQPLPTVTTAAKIVTQIDKIVVQPAPDPALIERTENEYREKLQAAIEAHKKYPRRARRLRQQGSVLIAFKVQKDGLIMNLKVASPSDSTILDQAAMETVQKISGLFPLPDELNRTEWAFTVPINYYLR